MKKIIVNKEEYTDIVRTEGAIAIMSVIVNETRHRVAKGTLNAKEIIDIILDLREDFVKDYISQLEKVGWEDTGVNNLQAVSENTIIKEDD